MGLPPVTVNNRTFLLSIIGHQLCGYEPIYFTRINEF